MPWKRRRGGARRWRVVGIGGGAGGGRRWEEPGVRAPGDGGGVAGPSLCGVAEQHAELDGSGVRCGTRGRVEGFGCLPTLGFQIEALLEIVFKGQLQPNSQI